MTFHDLNISNETVIILQKRIPWLSQRSKGSVDLQYLSSLDIVNNDSTKVFSTIQKRFPKGFKNTMKNAIHTMFQ